MIKKILFSLALLSGLHVTAQVFDIDSLNSFKKQNKLSGKEQFFNPKGGTKILKVSKQHKSQSTQSTSCACWVPRDNTFHYVPFDGSGGSGGPGVAPTYANDDWSTLGIKLPFNFCLYGKSVGVTGDSLYINNNGNISFGAPYSTFTADSFPNRSYVMIAPFWGDVETTNPGSGFVYYQLTSTHLIVQWDSVDCYQSFGSSAANVNLKNTFQLIITDGTDPILSPGTNVGFCYGDMQWTTGDASGGSGTGFGGFPATVGINNGDSVNYLQISLFNLPGNVYTNPTGIPRSGVRWLDNQSFVFDACGTGGNLPPIATGASSCGDTLTICHAGDTLIYTTHFLGSKPTQTVTCTGNGGTLGSHFSVLHTTTGTSASITFMVATGSLAPGYYNMSVTGTGTGTPPLSTTVNYVIHILNSAIPSPSVTLSPNPACLSQHPVVTLTNCSQFDTHVWSNGDTTCSFSVTTTDTLYLTVTKTGCYQSKVTFIKVSPNPVATVGGLLTYCPPTNGTTVYVNQPITVGTAPFTYNWDGGVAATDTLHNAVAGTHSVIVTDANGCKDTVSVSVVSNAPNLTISATGNLCTGTVTLSPSITTGISYSWSPGGASTQNLSVTSGGIYTCSVVINSCTVSASYTLTPPVIPVVSISGDTTICPGQNSVLTASATPSGAYTYHWYNGSTNIGNASTQTVNTAGTAYSVVGVNNNTQCKDSITFFVNMYSNPNVNISGNNTICAGKNDLLTANPSGGNPSYTYSWTPGSASTQTVNITSAAIYTVTVTDSKGCKNSAQYIVKLSTPKITAPKNTYVCPGTTAMIHANGSGTAPLHFLWYPSLTTSQTFTTTIAGTYSIVMTDVYGCKDSVTVSVVYNPVPEANITYTPPPPIEAGTSIIFLDASTVSTGSITSDSWTFGDTATALNNFNPSHTYNTGGHYAVTLMVKSDKGCLDTALIYVDVQYPVVAPNIITPNGDGLNEFLEFKNLLNFKNNKLWIYNRWGNLLYQSDDYKNNWSGKDHVDGTYYYILEVPDKKKTFKNFFTLIR